MNYYKKVCVLKQVEEGFSINNRAVSGIARIEFESGVTTLFLSVINIATASSGNYRFYACDEGLKLYSLELGFRPTSLTKVIDGLSDKTPTFEKGFACGIFFVKDSVPVLIAFAKSDSCSLSPADLKKAVAERCLIEHKSAIAEKPLVDRVSCTPKDDYSTYNDEAVATENYYDLDDGIKEKIKAIGDINSEVLRHDDGIFNSGNQAEKEEGQTESCPNENETNACYSTANEKGRYFDKVKGEIYDIFDKFCEDNTLLSLFPESQWARINYADDKYYVVGLIKENGKEKYICYGVPAPFSKEPPKELKGFCTFIPASVYDLFGNGFWMMFQCADTGECVKKA
ncbi:MAG: hypothetical protein IJZ73_02980 [Clostridia bacterium]|nr:hypothetical protein [Clostridia bacterium]